MNRLVRGSIMVVAAAVSWACTTDLGKDADKTDHLTATPSVVLVPNTDSQTVDVEALNPQGGQLAADFSVSNTGAGIIVRQDTSFLPIPGGHSPTRARYVVRPATTTTFVSTSFTVAADGKTVIVPVSVVPVTLDIPFSVLTPALGQTVTLTAPTNVLFTDSTRVLVGGLDAVITSVAADGSTISFLLGPNLTDQVAFVFNVQVSYIPGQVFDSIPTTGKVTTPTVTAIPGTFDDLTPAVGDTVTLTLASPFKALPTATVSFGVNAALVTGISADSSSISFLPPPTSSGVADLTDIIVTDVPVPLALPSVATLTVANATTYTGTAALATAPTVAVPAASGQTTGFFDLGSWGGTCSGAPCQWYKINIAAAGDIDFSSTWDNTSDLGIYVKASNGTTSIGACDAAGNGAAAKPEACTITFPSAGVYYVQMQNFAPFYPDPDPLWFEITMTAP